jgi:hypothetical protein
MAAHQRRDLGGEGGEGLAQAGDLRRQAAQHARVSGVLEPVGFGDQHGLDLLAPRLELLQGRLLRARRLIEAQSRGMGAIAGEHAGIDRVGLGQAEILGEEAHPRAMRPVHLEAQLAAGREHVTLVAAGRLADDEQGSEPLVGIALELGLEQAPNGGWRVGKPHLPVAGQRVHDEMVLGHFERNDVIELVLSRAHHHGVRPIILDCMRPCEASLPFGWTRHGAARVGDNLRPRGSIPAGTARRPLTGVATPVSGPNP